jgi:Tol biopolymer transport system component
MKPQLLMAATFILIFSFLLAAPTNAPLASSTKTTTLVTVSSSGTKANGSSYIPFISPDGRFVSFDSDANNLVIGDTNVCDGNFDRCDDAFVHDLITGETIRVSVSTSGEQGNQRSSAGPMSQDGRYITFRSWASNLVPGDQNNFCTNNAVDWDVNCPDVFVYDRLTAGIERVNVSSSGEEANSLSDTPSISADGRFILFSSTADNLVPGDTNNYCDWIYGDRLPGADNCSDVFVHDRQTGETERVSVASNGDQANGESFSDTSSISADGRFVVFISDADNLEGGEIDNWCDRDYDDFHGEPCYDVFLHDRLTGETKHISKSSSASPVEDGDSYHAVISADGRYIAYSSEDLIVPGDGNGEQDIFLYDRITGETEIISESTNGVIGNGFSQTPFVSSTGRFIAFTSEADNLVLNDTNDSWDIFLHDRQTGETELISVSTGGEQADANSNFLYISGDGRSVVFSSGANNLVEGDENSVDIFLRDRGLEPMDYPPAAYLPLVLVRR